MDDICCGQTYSPSNDVCDRQIRRKNVGVWWFLMLFFVIMRYTKQLLRINTICRWENDVYYQIIWWEWRYDMMDWWNDWMLDSIIQWDPDVVRGTISRAFYLVRGVYQRSLWVSTLKLTVLTFMWDDSTLLWQLSTMTRLIDVVRIL